MTRSSEIEMKPYVPSVVCLSMTKRVRDRQITRVVRSCYRKKYRRNEITTQEEVIRLDIATILTQDHTLLLSLWRVSLFVREKKSRGFESMGGGYVGPTAKGTKEVFCSLYQSLLVLYLFHLFSCSRFARQRSFTTSRLCWYLF